MTTPTLRQLEIFAQMVASGNIADCALALGMAEAAVKSELRALQHRLGHQLFVIEGTDFTLTPIGQKTVDAMALLTAGASPQEEAEASAPQVEEADSDEAGVEEIAAEETETAEAAAEETGAEDIPDPAPTVAAEAEQEIPSQDETAAPEVITEDEADIPYAADSAPTPEIVSAENADAPQDLEDDPAEEAISAPVPDEQLETEQPALLDEASDILELAGFAEPEAAPLPAPAALDDMPSPSTLIKAAPALDDIEWPPPVKRMSWVTDEPLELTELAPEPVLELSPEPLDASGGIAEPIEEPALTEEAPVLAEDALDDSSPAQDSEKVVPLPIVNTLAVRVVFAAPAPATVPPPTVISLFAAVPLPVPANDPEPAPPLAPAPVVELKHAQQQVTLAAHPSVFGHFQEALTAFEQANPDVAIALELDAFTAMRAEPLLASGEVDIVYYYAMGERERFESRYVWSESLSIFIGAAHPLAQQETITVEDLVGVRPVLLGSRNPLRPILDNAMIRGGVDLWHPALETDNLYDIMTAVRDGAGYFAAFGPLARDFGKMPGIRRLPLVDPLPPVEVRQAVREDMRDDPVISSLAEYLFR
ncbi:LysR family transcriptional regulator [Sphingobium phenoxybenzoativorans]|uniref:LysR family transcriptional regulator n=1 Tax=Sphingobium phenoxybenzoativorans TaxID=1592790 RepID=A0A975KAE2_9SPHN|nr:LysR family transcriptional regulator [Sphingobium phenoxybenzoativorans]QUT06993.1 LysR family transcriptional regulator [Sphingobium phenoxybenzoativorans]